MDRNSEHIMISERSHHFRIMRKDDSSRSDAVYSMAKHIEQGLGFILGCSPSHNHLSC